MGKMSDIVFIFKELKCSPVRAGVCVALYVCVVKGDGHGWCAGINHIRQMGEREEREFAILSNKKLNAPRALLWISTKIYVVMSNANKSAYACTLLLEKRCRLWKWATMVGKLLTVLHVIQYWSFPRGNRCSGHSEICLNTHLNCIDEHNRLCEWRWSLKKLDIEHDCCATLERGGGANCGGKRPFARIERIGEKRETTFESLE